MNPVADLLPHYADLVIRVGLNLQVGQRLLITDLNSSFGVPHAAAPLVREIVKAAYRVGAPFVDVIWADEDITRARFELAPRDSFGEFATWHAKLAFDYLERGDALLILGARDPDLLSAYDTALTTKAQHVAHEHLAPVLGHIVRNSTNWCVIGAATAPWAAKVFPAIPPEAQQGALWDAILKVNRLDQPDPLGAWQAHIKKLATWSDYLNTKRYRALRYTGPGTDLTIGLPAGHIWGSGKMVTQRGVPFTANLPTEEVFTLPHREQADGVVTASMPLSHAGTLIEDFTLHFEGGQVVKASAKRGDAVLQKMLDADPGARRLGEVALVPHSSPISQLGILFYSTLFDENAASHIALGRAYKFTMRDMASASDEEFVRMGGNTSLIHVDFMIGNANLDVDGVTDDGRAEPLMRAGEWAF